MGYTVRIYSGISTKYTFSLHIDTDKELERVKEALRPLGYNFRTPSR